MARKLPKKRRKRVGKNTKGLTPNEVASTDLPVSLEKLTDQIVSDGGCVLSTYREPLGGNWQIFASLPLSLIQPTSYQRDLSDTHVKRLAEKIEKLNRFLDPIIVIRYEGKYYTPNGFHRMSAMQKLGCKTIVALVVAETEVAYQILALNTEKAYNVKEKSLEAIRLLKELAKETPSSLEADFGSELEEAAYPILGACYEKNPRFSGGAYFSILRKTESFLEEKLGKSLTQREKQAGVILSLDKEVVKIVEKLKKQGLTSPFLKTFVIARLNPLRFRKTPLSFEDTMDKMFESAEKFDPSKIRPDHLANTAGSLEDN